MGGWAEKMPSKTRINGEIWETWGATYGRNGWVGEKKHAPPVESEGARGVRGAQVPQPERLVLAPRDDTVRLRHELDDFDHRLVACEH